MTPLLLAVLALVLAGPVPALMGRAASWRQVPRAAMVLWQAVALAAVLAALGAGLSLFTGAVDARVGPGEALVALGAAVLTLLVLGRLLLSAHRVGTRLRALRRRHRVLLDALGEGTGDLRVLAHATPMAYCVPGLARSRVVLTAGTVDRLAEEELAAVLRHERAHLRARHDLVLEAFRVLHRAFPRYVSSAGALREVTLLVEVLADRAAVQHTGPAPLLRALLTLAEARAPEATLGAQAGLAARVAVLEDPRPRPLLAAALAAAAVAVLLLPTALVVWPWVRGLG